MEQPKCAVHRAAVGKSTRYVWVEKDQVRRLGGLLVVLAPNPALQAGEVVFGTEVITSPGASPAGR